MRHIKFRIFDTFENKMIYDDVASYISFNDDGVVNNRNIFGFTHVMQFTGLYDKNGKEIYEGDILEESGIHSRFEVVWIQDWCKFELKWERVSKAVQFPEWNRGIKMKIIGNVHENKELLN